MNLEVHIPSLLLPLEIFQLIAKPSVPALERLLSRSDWTRLDVADDHFPLLDLWGLKKPYAIAPVLAEWDGFELGLSAWMFAEPVNLTPERDWLKLAPARLLNVTPDESLQLVEALNRHFSGQGIRFSFREPGRWYVQCQPEEIPSTTPVEAASLDPLIKCQPVSKGTINWRSLQNEAQMLLHAHPVNRSREISGKPTINGVWFWGGGTAPLPRAPELECLLTDSPLFLQLAKQTGIETRSVAPPTWRRIRGNALVFIEELSNQTRDSDLLKWVSTIERLDQTWFEPISNALSQGAITRLTIRVLDRPNEKVFTLTRRSLKFRFWRNAKPLSSYA